MSGHGRHTNKMIDPLQTYYEHAIQWNKVYNTDGKKTAIMTILREARLSSKAPRTRICHETFEIVPQEVLWSIWGSHQNIMKSPPLPNVT